MSTVAAGTVDAGASFCGFSRDSSVLATNGEDRAILLRDARDLSVRRALRGHSARIRGVRFAPGGAEMGSFDDAGITRIWTLEDGSIRLTLATQGQSTDSLAFSPDRQRIATGQSDGAIRIWDAADGRLLVTLRGHRRAWAG